MKTFKIYENPAGNRKALKRGWSWPGFFFGPIWAFIKKMWGLGTVLLIAVIILAIFPAGSEIGLLAALVNFGIYIACGINGNGWREKNLISRGYEYCATVSAANPEGAMAVFLKGPSDSEVNQNGKE